VIPALTRRLVKTTTTALRQDRHDTPPLPMSSGGWGVILNFKFSGRHNVFDRGHETFAPPIPPLPPSPPPYVRPSHIQKNWGKNSFQIFLARYSTALSEIQYDMDDDNIFEKIWQRMFKKIKLFFLLNFINFNLAQRIKIPLQSTFIVFVRNEQNGH
jgi:hypothetical protein